MNRLYIPILLLFLINLIPAKAQLFYKKPLYPNTFSQKGKYYNGTGGRGFWSFTKFDSLGRKVEVERHRKNKLLSVEKFIYNSNNDIIYNLVSRNDSDFKKLDTLLSFEYSYSKNIISHQKRILGFSKKDTTTTQIKENRGDSVLVYEEITRYYRPKTNTIDEFKTEYTFHHKNGLLTSLKEYDINEKKTETTFWEYYPNGYTKRRKITRVPEDKTSMYSGGPASDDMFFIYTFDRKERIKKLFYEIDGKKYKIAVYSYKP